MVNLKVFNKEEKKDMTVYLLLEEGEECGYVAVKAVDDRGCEYSGGYLLRINRSGTIYRFPHVNPIFGFKLDVEGRIVDI
jgi:hypothetical protein